MGGLAQAKPKSGGHLDKEYHAPVSFKLAQLLSPLSFNFF
jgi:hypothetical protein